MDVLSEMDFTEHQSVKSWQEAVSQMGKKNESMKNAFTNQEIMGPHRLAGARLLRSALFETCISTLILLSFVLMVVEADFEGIQPRWMVSMNFVLMVIYTLEVILRAYVFRKRFFCSVLNLFDVAVVVGELATQIADALGAKATPSFVILRIFRTLRLFRGVKVITKCPQLALMVKGLVNGTSAAMYGAALMLVMITIWSVCAVQFINPVNEKVARTGVYDGCDRCERAFATVRHSMLTFLQQIVMGDDWGNVIIPIVEEAPETAFFFGAVFVSVQFTIMNVILAVIVDIALKASQDDIIHLLQRKEDEYKAAASKLTEICQDMDEDGSGDLTESEILAGFDLCEDFRNILLAMDIKKEDMHIVFNILDSDFSGTVNYDEFITELFKMKKHDSHTLLVFIKHYVTEIRRDVQEQMRVLKRDLFSGMKSFASEHGTTGTASSSIAGHSQCHAGLQVHFREQPSLCVPDAVPEGSVPDIVSAVPKSSEESLRDLGEELRNLKKSISDDLRHSMLDIVQEALRPIQASELASRERQQCGNECEEKSSKSKGSEAKLESGAVGGKPLGPPPLFPLTLPKVNEPKPQVTQVRERRQPSAWAARGCCDVEPANHNRTLQ